MDSDSSIRAAGNLGGSPPVSPAERSISVLVVDDMYLIRKQVGHLIEADVRLTLVGAACDGVEAVEMIEALHPDLVLLDVFMPRLDGAGVLKWIKEKVPDTKVLILTASPDPRLYDTLMSEPDSLLYKDAVAAPGQLCGEIVALLAGREDTTGQELLRLAAPLAKDRPKLTQGELRILRRAAAGDSAKQIAPRLGLSRGYVENQLSRIHEKLHVTSTTHAVTKAIEMGLLSVGDWPPTK